jgi:hypothetical protein
LNPSSEICDVISATEDVITESDLFSIKENPVVGHLRIEASGNEHLEIIDLSGTVLHRFDIDRGDNIEDVSKLPDGLFIIRSQTGQTQKFIKI